MPDSDDLFGDDPEFKQFADELERHREALYQLVSDYMDEEGVSEAFASHLLLDATVHMRMAAYGTCVESPRRLAAHDPSGTIFHRCLRAMARAASSMSGLSLPPSAGLTFGMS